MHEFGSAGLVTGYIKQLLATFELPTMRVYTKELEKYYDLHGKESPFVIESFDKLKLTADKQQLVDNMNIKTVSKDEYDILANSQAVQIDEDIRVPYLKDGRIQFLLGGYYTNDNTFIPGKWQSKDLDVNKSQGGLWEIYNRGAAYLNQTKRLQIRNNIYDSYTHEYLGNYLRFLRDYDDLDLMSLYNCFSNRLCSSTTGLDIKIGESKIYGRFNALDSNYKIYLVPVKLFKNYTIAIDSRTPVEICCGIYNNKLNTTKDAYNQLLECTYYKATSPRFNQPFLYTALTDIAPKALSDFPTSAEIESHSNARKFIAQIADRESNLMLILKVHKDVTSSITILEGDYRGWNDFSSKFVVNTSANIQSTLVEKKILLNHNHTVIPNEAIYADLEAPLITPLQLLQLNTEKHMPFADRLLEYLMDMCITGKQDDPRENVQMAQQVSGLHFKGETLPLRYFIARDSQNNNSHIIWIGRQLCSETGDYYLPVNSLVLHRFNKSGEDSVIGSMDKWLTDNNLRIDSNWYSYEPLAIDQNLQSGIWHDSLQKLFYRYMLNNTEHEFSVHRDLLGYVDKDVEKYFIALKKDKKTKKTLKKTMLNFDTWEELE
jgi:hypothetical protein